jgi:hypothetical protein
MDTIKPTYFVYITSSIYTKNLHNIMYILAMDKQKKVGGGSSFDMQTCLFAHCENSLHNHHHHYYLYYYNNCRTGLIMTAPTAELGTCSCCSFLTSRIFASLTRLGGGFFCMLCCISPQNCGLYHFLMLLLIVVTTTQ